MSDTHSASAGEAASTRGGWIEAICFAIALAVLNITYAIAQRQGVTPVALLFWAMPVGAVSLLAVSGLGPHWRQIVAHPLSLVVGSGIIAMEGVYYLLIGHVSPTDASVIVRLGVPTAMLMGFVFARRRPSRLSVVGALVILAVILWYVPQMRTGAPLTALGLGALCGFIISARSFAAEKHPWNQSARTIAEKMRVTGLVLLLTSAIGAIVVLAASGAASSGQFVAPAWLPSFADLLHMPAILLGLFLGVCVLTVMQYLGFSIVVKLGAENFVATTAFIPVTTLGLQQLAVVAGLLDAVPIDWSVMPAMLGLLAGVALVIGGGRRPR